MHNSKKLKFLSSLSPLTKYRGFLKLQLLKGTECCALIFSETGPRPLRKKFKLEIWFLLTKQKMEFAENSFSVAQTKNSVASGILLDLAQENNLLAVSNRSQFFYFICIRLAKHREIVCSHCVALRSFGGKMTRNSSIYSKIYLKTIQIA